MKRDRDRWERKYAGKDRRVSEADPLLTDHANLLTGGRAIDVACGLGANALFVAERGYEVDAVDISLAALKELDGAAKRKGLPVRALLADLDDFPIPRGMYDLVLVFSFFSPLLMPAMQKSLRSGGLLFYATYNLNHTAVQPDFNPKYLVPSGGLGAYFPDLTRVLDEPEAGEAGNVSRLIGRKQEMFRS